jgi:8-oxo-dGTP diphosphatase
MSKTVDEGSDKKPAAYRDSAGKSLVDYPRPSVAVDTALLTLGSAGVLEVLQVRRPDGRGWRLPGTFLHPGERLIDAVHRSLAEKAGVTGLNPRQLHVFDDPTRDNRGWVLSVAHIDVVPLDRLMVDEQARRAGVRLISVTDPGRLPHGHSDIIELAVLRLRARYSTSPDPDHLLGEAFTLRELRLVHEAVAGQPLLRDTFRRSMAEHLTATAEMTNGLRGRPAELFRRG